MIDFTKQDALILQKDCLQALQEQHMKDLQLQMLQDAGRNNHPSLAGPLAPLATQNPVQFMTPTFIHVCLDLGVLTVLILYPGLAQC